MVTSEPILHTESRELLVAGESLSVTHARAEDGERIAGRHVHPGHAEAFYVLEGELSLSSGPTGRRSRSARAASSPCPPASLTHTAPPATLGHGGLVIHACDGGLADFMRGVRDGVDVRWDIAPVPGDGA
jgi:hypothetical protein